MTTPERDDLYREIAQLRDLADFVVPVGSGLITSSERARLSPDRAVWLRLRLEELRDARARAEFEARYYFVGGGES